MTSVGHLNLIHSGEARELSPRALCGHFRSFLLSDARRKITASRGASVLNLIISFFQEPQCNKSNQVSNAIIRRLWLHSVCAKHPEFPEGRDGKPTRICSCLERDIWLKVPGGESKGKVMPQCSRKWSKACSALLPPALLQSMKGKHLYN